MTPFRSLSARTLSLAALAACLAAAPAVAQNVEASARGGAALESLSTSDIRQVQAKLRTLGYYDGAVDGVWGAGTASAVTRYETRQGGHATGSTTPSGDTLRALGLDTSGNISGSAGGNIPNSASGNIPNSANSRIGAKTTPDTEMNMETGTGTGTQTGPSVGTGADANVGVDADVGTGTSLLNQSR